MSENCRAEFDFLENDVIGDEMTGADKLELEWVVYMVFKAGEDETADKAGLEDERDAVLNGKDVILGAKELGMVNGGPLRG